MNNHTFAATQQLCNDLARAYNISAREIVSYAVSQFVKRAQDLTIRGAGRRAGAGLAAKAAAAKREYEDYLEFRIKGVRFRKLGDPALGTHRGRITPRVILKNRLPKNKKQVAAYFRKAKALQGRFAAGWNAAAFAKKVAVPYWVKKHGVRDGAWKKMFAANTYAETVVFDAESKGSGHGNINYFVKTAVASVENELGGDKSSFIAANVRKHMKKLMKT